MEFPIGKGPSHEETSEAVTKPRTRNRSIINYVKLGDVDSLKIARDLDKNLLLIKTPQGNSLLHIAVKFSMLEAIEFIHGEEPTLIRQKNKKGDIPLHLAARNGYLKILVSLLEKWKDGHKETNENGDTPLHDAIRNSEKSKVSTVTRQLVMLFLESLETPTFPQVNIRGESLLYLAAQSGLEKTIQWILFSPALTNRIEYCGPEESTALHIAVDNGYTDVTKCLLELKPNLVQSLGHKMVSLLQSAVQCGRADMINLLMEHDDYYAYLTVDSSECVDNAQESLIHCAARMGHVHIIQVLLKYFPDFLDVVNKDGQNTLHVAVQHKSVEVVLYILENENFKELLNEPDKKGKTPLQLATAICDNDKNDKFATRISHFLERDSLGGNFVTNKKRAMTKATLGHSDQYLDKRHQDGTLFTLVEKGDITGIKQFCKDKHELLLDENIKGDSLLHLAVKKGKLEVVNWLIDEAEKVPAQLLGDMMRKTDKKGNTPLHKAILSGHFNISNKLLETVLKNDLFLTGFPQLNMNNESLLFLAVKYGSIDILKKLLSLIPHTDLKYGGPNQTTALHLAVERGLSVMVEALLEADISYLKVEDKRGFTPFVVAVLKDNFQLLKALSGTPERKAVTEKVSKLAIATAAKMGHLRIFKELLILFPHLNHEIEIDDSGHTVLHLAIMNKRHELFKYILVNPKFKDLLNQPDKKGNTPLHVAAATSYPLAIRLLSRGDKINKDVENKEGQSPLAIFYSEVPPALTNRWVRSHFLLRYLSPKGEPIVIQDPEKRKKVAEMTEKITAHAQNHVNNTTIVAALMCTVTFAAAFTVPGGYKNDGPEEGFPVLLRATVFKIFLISNAIAMCCSITVTFLSVYATANSYVADFAMYYGVFVLCPLWTAFVALLVAFATGTYTVVGPNASWLAIFICVLCGILPILTTALLRLSLPGIIPRGELLHTVDYPKRIERSAWLSGISRSISKKHWAISRSISNKFMEPPTNKHQIDV